MTRPALILFLLVTALPVPAAERLLDLQPGVPCAGISQIEQGLGSIEITGSADGGMEFRGVYAGREARIIYRCKESSLTEQIIQIVISGRDQALGFAEQQKAELASQLGDPIHDGLNLPVWRRLLFGILGGDLDYLMSVVVWGRADQDLMLSVTAAGDDRWLITLSRGSSKLEYIINS